MEKISNYFGHLKLSFSTMSKNQYFEVFAIFFHDNKIISEIQDHIRAPRQTVHRTVLKMNSVCVQNALDIAPTL